MNLPIAPGDSGTNAYGIWPFGVHGGSHALDGHPGFDIEFRPGASVLAAADGTVQNVTADSAAAGRYVIRIDHVVGQAHYATDYTNVSAIAPGVAPGQTILGGSPLGTAGTQTQFIGSSLVTWAMTHFQVNDFSRNEGLSNPNAVSPEAVLSAAGRATFETIWQTAAYQTEWCEPFATNSRLAGFPIPRTWTIQSGSLPEHLDVRCVMGGSLDPTSTRFVMPMGRRVNPGHFVWTRLRSHCPASTCSQPPAPFVLGSMTSSTRRCSSLWAPRAPRGPPHWPARRCSAPRAKHRFSGAPRAPRGPPHWPARRCSAPRAKHRFSGAPRAPSVESGTGGPSTLAGATLFGTAR